VKRSRSGLLLGVALLVAALGAFAASEHPDTLERFLGMHAKPAGEEPPPPLLPAPLPEYQTPGVEPAGWSTLVAGAAGVLATFGIVTLLAALAAARRARTHAGPPEPRAS
jgi:hypothetical protein